MALTEYNSILREKSSIVIHIQVHFVLDVNILTLTIKKKTQIEWQYKSCKKIHEKKERQYTGDVSRILVVNTLLTYCSSNLKRSVSIDIASQSDTL
jgi:hypothetical protein